MARVLASTLLSHDLIASFSIDLMVLAILDCLAISDTLALLPTCELLDHPNNEKPSCNQSIPLDASSFDCSSSKSPVLLNQSVSKSFADCIHLSMDSLVPVACVPNWNAITPGIRLISGINVLTGIDVALTNLFFAHSAFIKSVVDSDSPIHTLGIAAGIHPITDPAASAVFLRSSQPNEAFTGIDDPRKLENAAGAFLAIVIT